KRSCSDQAKPLLAEEEVQQQEQGTAAQTTPNTPPPVCVDRAQDPITNTTPTSSILPSPHMTLEEETAYTILICGRKDDQGDLPPRITLDPRWYYNDQLTNADFPQLLAQHEAEWAAKK